MRHAQQHGVPLRVLYKAAPRAPRKAAPTRGAGEGSAACPTERRPSTRALEGGAPRAAQSRPYTGRRGMQCSMPNSTAYQYACLIKRRSARRAKLPLHGAQGHAVQHACKLQPKRCYGFAGATRPLQCTARTGGLRRKHRTHPRRVATWRYHCQSAPLPPDAPPTEHRPRAKRCGPRPQRRTGNQGFGVAPGVGPEPGTTHDADVSQRLLSEPLNHPVGMACEARCDSRGV